MDERAKRLAEALSEVLTAIELHEERRPNSFSVLLPVDIYSMQQMADHSDSGEFFLKDPIGYGLRRSVRKIGELLARDFPDEMQKVAEMAAGLSSDRSYGIRVSIVDKNWDGLNKSNGGQWIA